MLQLYTDIGLELRVERSGFAGVVTTLVVKGSVVSGSSVVVVLGSSVVVVFFGVPEVPVDLYVV